MKTPYALMIVFCLLGAVSVSPAAAQAIQGPPGSAGGILGGRRPPDGNRVTHEVEMTVNVNSGYDENTGVESGPVPAGTDLFAGSASSASAVLQYRRGTNSRFFLGTAQVDVNRYSYSGTDRPLTAGSLQWNTELGRRSGLRVDLTGGIESTHLFNSGAVFGYESDSVLPVVNPSQGIIDQRWLAARTHASFHRNWTPRQRTAFEFGGRFREAQSGLTLSSRSQSGSVRHALNLSSSARFEFIYRSFGHRQVTADGSPENLRSHTGEMSMRLDRRISSTRTAGVSLGGGAAYTKSRGTSSSAPYEVVLPSASLSARIDLTRTFALTFEARRAISVLEGLTPEPFSTDQVSLSLGGMVARRLRIEIAGIYSKGTSALVGPSSFESGAGSAEIQYGLTQRAAFFASYRHYRHTLTQITPLQLGFPSTPEQRSARVGITYWLPLYGTF